MTAKSLEEIYGSSPDLSTKGAEPAQPEPLPITADEPNEDMGDNVIPDTPIPDKSAPPALDDDLPKDVAGIRAAVQDERRKRREYEAKVADHEKRASEYERQLADERRRSQEWEQNARALHERDQQWQKLQQRQQKPDALIDPEAAMQYQNQQYQATLNHEMAQRDSAIFETRVELSQEMMRSRYPDYDDIESVFADEMARSPVLQQELRAQPLPAKYAYEVGKRIKLNREMGADPDAYIQRKIAEALAAQAVQTQQIQAPLTPTVPTIPTASRPASPQSLARVTSVSPRSQQVYTGPTPLEDIYR
jgi:hypothetical protein